MHVTRPQREVVPEQLHDERAVLVALLAKGVQFRDGVIESRFGQSTRAVRTVQNFVVEHAEVQCQTQPINFFVKTQIYRLIIKKLNLMGCVGGSSVVAISLALL